MSAIVSNTKDKPPATKIRQSAEVFRYFGFHFYNRQIQPCFVLNIRLLPPLINQAR